MSDDFADQQPPDQLVIGGPEAPRSRKGLWIGGGVLGVLAVGGGVAAWAAASFFSQGAQPAEVLPASTIGYVSVDLDPSGGQKIAALKLARKFPAFKDKVGLKADDDVRKWLIDQFTDGTDCKLDFDQDVAPWLGSRAAFAAVGTEKPVPIIVLQTTDRDKAEAGLKQLMDCAGGSDDAGWTVDGDWIVLAESADQAKKVVAEADKGTLADDSDFQSWTDKAGDSGILSAYAAPAAGQALVESWGSTDSEESAEPDVDTACSPDNLSEDFTREDCEKVFGDLESSTGGAGVAADPFGMLDSCPGLLDRSGQNERLQAQLADFKGAAATLRFGDDGVELEMVGDTRAFGAGGLGKPQSKPLITSLPADTAAAFGVAMPHGWVDTAVKGLEDLCGEGGDSAALFAPFNKATGLDLPADLEKLVGDSAALALGPGIDVEGLVNSSDPSDLPLALKTRGDKDTIDRVAAKLRSSIDAPAGVLEPVAGDDGVAVGLDKGFVADVAKGGRLGSSDTFTSVVPEADRASGVFYVDFDALDDAIKQMAGGDDEVTDNLAPLRALGLSSWADGDVSHGLVKLSLR